MYFLERSFMSSIYLHFEVILILYILYAQQKKKKDEKDFELMK